MNDIAEDDEFDDEPETDAAENPSDGKRYYRLYHMQRRMRELLALPAPACDERDYLTDMGVPPEKIDNCTLLMGILFHMAVEGNMRAFQELRHIAGENETRLDRRIKLANLAKTKAQTEDIKRKHLENEEDFSGDVHSLMEAFGDSAASIWQNGGEETFINEQEKESF